MRALSALQSDATLTDDKEAQRLVAAISTAMDGLDNAQPANATVLAQLDPKLDKIELAVWSSTSNALWAVTSAEDTRSVIRLAGDGTVAGRTSIGDVRPDILVGHQGGALVVDGEKRSVTRVNDGAVSTYPIPTQEDILDAFVFADSLYALTDKSILKISDLDTKKPVTKQWLTAQDQLAVGAARIWVDGNIYTLGRDGTLATYFKGKQTETAKVPLEPSGKWRLVPTNDPSQLAVASADHMRAYGFSIADGALTHTLKLDSQQPLVLMAEGPVGSVIAVTRDNRIWRLQ